LPTKRQLRTCAACGEKYSRQRPRCPECGEPNESKSQVRTPTSSTIRLAIGLIIGCGLLFLGGFIVTKPLIVVLLLVSAAVVISYSIYLYLRGL
jgi:hypothetical protein